MSYLYVAEAPETGEAIIVKVLSPQYLGHPEMVSRFLREADIIRMADHPNIVKLLGSGSWEGGVYIAMEYVQGVSLRQYLQKVPLSLKRAIELILEIAYALCHLHTHRVIHRDLKPENILVTKEGQIKVIDFGIAQLLFDNKLLQSEQKRLIGTPVYMSPEQRENPENVSFPSDIYSLGIIAYELILGRSSHGHVVIGLMPKGIQKILAKALQTDPQNRYTDVVDFIGDLSLYLHSKEPLKSEGQFSEELESMFKLSHELLQPSHPEIPLNIGQAIDTDFQFPSLVYNWIDKEEGKKLFFCFEKVSTGWDPVLTYSYLKGLMEGTLESTASLNETLAKVNSRLAQAKQASPIQGALIAFDFNNHEMEVFICGPIKLLKIDRTTLKIERVQTINVPLGLTMTAAFQSMKLKMQKEEIYLLKPAIEAKSIFNTEKFLLENKDSSPQKLADDLLRKFKLYEPKSLNERLFFVICFTPT